MVKNCHCGMKGFLSFLVLRLISSKQMSGEEIRQEIKKRKGVKPSAGTIYPALKYLSKSGFIQEVKKSGKMKKYKLTKAGQKELKIATKRFVMIFCDMQGEFDKQNPKL